MEYKKYLVCKFKRFVGYFFVKLKIYTKTRNLYTNKSKKQGNVYKIKKFVYK